MKDWINLKIDPFTNVDIRFGDNIQLTSDTRIIVGLVHDPGLSFPNVVISLERGNYNMNFRLGFLYDDPIDYNVPVKILIERKDSGGDIHFFININEKWIDIERVRFLDHSPHASENLSYYIVEKGITEESVETDNDPVTYKIAFGQTSITLVVDYELIEQFENLKELILANAIIWACVRSQNRVIQRIEVTSIDEEFTVGIEYFFSNNPESEFDKLTIQPSMI